MLSKSHLCGFSCTTEISECPDPKLSSLWHVISSASVPQLFGVHAKSKQCSSGTSHMQARLASCSILSSVTEHVHLWYRRTRILNWWFSTKLSAKTPLCSKANLEPTFVHLSLFAPCILFCGDWHQISVAKLPSILPWLLRVSFLLHHLTTLSSCPPLFPHHLGTHWGAQGWAEISWRASVTTLRE